MCRRRTGDRLEPEIKAFRKDVFHRDYMRILSFAKARETLVRVKKSGRKMVLATSSEQSDLATYKRIVGMEDLVEEEASSKDAKSLKPAPDILPRRCRRREWARRRPLRWGTLLMTPKRRGGRDSRDWVDLRRLQVPEVMELRAETHGSRYNLAGFRCFTETLAVRTTRCVIFLSQGRNLSQQL